MTAYLSGVSSPALRELALERPAELGLLGTPDGSTIAQRSAFAMWALDNGCFAEFKRGGAPSSVADVRYGPSSTAGGTFDVGRWLAWLERIGPDGCLFATLPDVVGDYASTWERSSHFVARVAGLGFRPAFVLQDGLESDRFVWHSILNACEYHGGAVFVGGSTEWKLSPAARRLVAEARRLGVWTHMGRVNSGRRFEYARRIGCDSADGTFLGFGPTTNLPRLVGWLDAQAAELELEGVA